MVGHSIHVAVAVDGCYAMPLAVLVRSILESLAEERWLTLHVLDCGLSVQDWERLAASWPADRMRVHRYKVDRQQLHGLPLTHHFTHAAYARLLAPRLLPAEVRKVIYLDVDMLVLADLGELWDEQLRGDACLAVQDVSCPWIDCAAALPNYATCRQYLGTHPPIPNFQELGFSGDDPYFNSGLLVINMDRWRAEQIGQSVRDCLRGNHTHVRSADQYGLNVVLRGHWRGLDLSWNLGSHIYRYPDQLGSPFDWDAVLRCRSAPRIVHFTTGDKPWLTPTANPYAGRFFELLETTSWQGWRPPPAWRYAILRKFRACRTVWDRVAWYRRLRP